MANFRSKLRYVQRCIDHEGFFYAFDSYHNFNEVKDPEFHELRVNFLEAGKALRKYVDEQAALEPKLEEDEY